MNYNYKVTITGVKGLFPKEVFPKLYSKRGFEKKRVRFVVPDNRHEFIYATDNKGNKLDIEL